MCCVSVCLCRCFPGVDVIGCVVRDVWGDVAWLVLFICVLGCVCVCVLFLE